MSSTQGFGGGFSRSLGGDGFGSGFQRPAVNYVAGIKHDLYTSGYFNDDLGWFEGRTPNFTAYPKDVIQDPATDDGSNFSRRWTGYFRAPTSETYTFYTSSDDSSLVWVGAAALSGWTIENATVDNSGVHGQKEESGAVDLVAGQYYPIQVFFGEMGGGDILTFSYSTGTISKTTDLTGLIYYNPDTPNGKGF